ncbi:MAG TPA: FapA family protein [Chloroflexota bacterium]|nr:FapA family protein [Chloroflexota bacterium]
MAEAQQVVRVTASTLDEARRRAARLLNAAPSLLEAEVVGARKSGLFGLGAPKLEVLLWLPAPEVDAPAGPIEPVEQPDAAAPNIAWQVRCEAGDLHLDVQVPGPWLSEVEEHIFSWPLDEYDRETVRRALSGAEVSPVRFAHIEPPEGSDPEAAFFIKVARDAMSAWAVPGRGGPSTPEDVRDALARAGVKWGLDPAAEAPLSGPVLWARGSHATPSRDALVEYLFSEEDELAALRPHVREDGTVDYRDLKPMYTVQPGTIVGRYLPAVDGEPGRDVFGQELAPVLPARDTPAERFAGRDVEVAENSIDLVAIKAGRPVREGARIDIVQLYATSGDVDFSTGNIDFNGEVYVAGDVQPGFKVRATGNVRIDGMVDSANVESGKDLLISGGINGHAESRIVSGGDLSARFIDSADVICEGNLLVISTVVRSNIVCGGSATVIGRGSIVGGKVKAVTGIRCNTAGSPAGVPTSLELDWLGAIHPGPNRERELARYRGSQVVVHRDVFPSTMVTINGAKFPVRDQLRGVSFEAADRGIALISASERLGPRRYG